MKTRLSLLVAVLGFVALGSCRKVDQIASPIVNVIVGDTSGRNGGGGSGGGSGSGGGNTTCPTGFTTCSGLTFGAFHPADTTITITNRYHVVGQIYVPTGSSNTVLVLSTKQCATPINTSAITSTSNPNVYNVDITLQGIAVCRDSISIRFDASSGPNTFVMATVVAGTGSGVTVTISPDSGSGAKGDTLQATCTVTGSSDHRCRWYSTDPSRVDVVATDTVFTVFTPHWGLGSRKGGFMYFDTKGSAKICAYWAPDPRAVACRTFTSRGVPGSGNLVPDSFQPLDWRRGVELKLPVRK